MKQLINMISGIILISGVLTSVARAEGGWFMSLYVGQYSDNAFNEIIRAQTKLQSSYIYALSVGKELGTWKKHIGMELEGQFAVHSGIQDHSEINAAFTLRWLTFPWNRYLNSSFAFGNGFSLTNK